MTSKTKVVFLVNLGSPQSSRWLDMYRYLAKFLSNPRVLNIPTPFRQILGGFIIPLLRSAPSGKLYDNIWQQNGSPLIAYSKQQAEKLSEKLPQWDVHWCMNISPHFFTDYLTDYLAKVDAAAIDEVVILPMYPQQADSTTMVTVDQLNAAMPADHPLRAKTTLIEDFFDNDHFVAYWAQQINGLLEDKPADLVLLSYHSLPLSHLVEKQKQVGKNCDGNCSDCYIVTEAQLQDTDRSCYRAACYATSELIRQKLGSNVPITTVFQSNIGKQWIEPNIIDVIEVTKAKNIVLAAPSFVSDCLETLEELGIRLMDQASAKNIICRLVPCPNDDDLMIDALSQIITASKEKAVS